MKKPGAPVLEKQETQLKEALERYFEAIRALANARKNVPHMESALCQQPKNAG